jgi:hypothetical protein
MDAFANISRALRGLLGQKSTPNPSMQPEVIAELVEPHQTELVTRQTLSFRATTIALPLSAPEIFALSHSKNRETRPKLDLRDIADGNSILIIKGVDLGVQFNSINHYYLWADGPKAYFTNVPESTLVRATLARMNSSTEPSPKGTIYCKDVEGLAVGNWIMMPQLRSVKGVTNMLVGGLGTDPVLQLWADTISEICILPLDKHQTVQLRAQVAREQV